MISRLKPRLGWEEIRTSLLPLRDARSRFEAEFANAFDASSAIAFSYGRSALWTFFKALDITNAEVIMPSYTCDVVAHAVVLSGNIPRFVDIDLFDYNMDLNQLEAAINERTSVVVATHLFGYPLNVERLSEIVKSAEKRFGHKIWIIQDCAHSFGARWMGKLVCSAGDAALFGLNISKQITSVFGGMLTTSDPSLADRIRQWRDRHFSSPGWTKSLRRFLYLLAVYPAFSEAMYGIVYWLQEGTSLLDYLTKAYHLDNKIHFPPDYMDQMLAFEAKVGLAQLQKYSKFLQCRREIAEYYTRQLQNMNNLILPPMVDGATYSHYVIRVPQETRASLLKAASDFGLQLGTVVDYVVPEMETYTVYASGPMPKSSQAARTVINLPLHLANIKSASRVVVTLKASMERVYHG
ncbi:MAG: DegT/DnrJ/EryC1/StrS family aminotransferase [Anaerolineales bacterium]